MIQNPGTVVLLRAHASLPEVKKMASPALPLRFPSSWEEMALEKVNAPFVSLDSALSLFPYGAGL